MDKLGSLRKELLSTEAFRIILKEAVSHYPKGLDYDPRGVTSEKQVDLWKAISAERKGFSEAFKFITGISIEDFNNE